MIRKAVYSLWTKPMELTGVGYNSERAYLESLALSVELSRKWFDEVELVTDSKGKELIKQSGIWFHRIRTDLDELNELDPHHWALAKIVACSVQQVPFMHIDQDVFWFKAPPKDFLEADACFQSLEADEWYQGYEVQRAWCKKWDRKPMYVNADLQFAYNCGIMGFNKPLNLIRYWMEDALSYIHFISQFDYTRYCTGLMFEQLFIAHRCKELGVRVKLLTDYAALDEDTWQLSDHTAVRLGYTHLMAESKRNPEIEQSVTRTLKKLAPHLYYRIAYHYEDFEP